ncbi:MAG TPA: ATP-binding protein [Candidatus Limnocylindrales bacterium]|nr:ATP-binding protein [Candidatus Limnocylindrales bacterium]
MDVVTLLIAAAFYLLFAASIRRWTQHRAALELAVVLVFSSTAAIFAASMINQVLPGLSPFLTPLATILLVAQPALMMRLVGLIVRLPRWAVPLAFGGAAVAITAFYATNRSVASVLFLVGYFALTEAIAASILFAESRRRLGLPRIRLSAAAAASILFGISILIAGLGAAARGGSGSGPEVTVASRLVALVAGGGYLAAFVPPRWLRDVVHRAMAFDLLKSVVGSPTGTDQQVLWNSLATSAATILGARRVIVRDGDTVLGEGPAPASSTGGSADATWATPRELSIPITNEGRTVATLSADLGGRPLFIEDDVTLIALLGSLTALAVEREVAVATLTEAALALDEADAVRASEARFRSLLEAEPNAILSLDGQGVIRWGTRTAAEMFGTDATKLVGRRLDELILPSGGIRGLQAAEGGVNRAQGTGRRRDGRTFPVEVATSPFTFDGEPSFLVVVTDITWRHEADALRDRFIGVLSHELRTPVTSIFGGTQVLLTKGARLDDATRNELLVDVAGEADRLQRMIENLLILARVERGADVLEVSPVLLHRMLPGVIEREREQAVGVTITADIPTSLPLVAADEESLSLVVRNLLSNAEKYAGRGANVHVVVTVDGPAAVTIRVLDDGPGLDAGEAASLFDLYYRSEATQSAPGSGIGLFVCRELVRAMGGRIWATPREAGGAEFGFTLPIWVDEPVAETPGQAAVSSRAASAAAGEILPIT